jgi:predicted DNA-binding WGR domain protein
MPVLKGGERRWENTTDNHYKFWTIQKQRDPDKGYKPHGFQTTWGRIGQGAQSNEKWFASEWARNAAYNKLVAEKEGKGYTETTKGVNTDVPVGDKADLKMPILIIKTPDDAAFAIKAIKEKKELAVEEMPLAPKKKIVTDDPFLDRLGDLDLDQ